MSTMRWDRLARLALVLVAPLGVVACGSDGPTTYATEGTVTFNGKPLAQGNVLFMPEAGPSETNPAATGLVDNGKFTLSTQAPGDGIPPGRYKVSVSSYTNVQTRDGQAIAKSNLPDRYANPDTSGIVVEIPEGGKSDIKIELTK